MDNLILKVSEKTKKRWWFSEDWNNKILVYSNQDLEFMGSVDYCKKQLEDILNE